MLRVNDVLGNGMRCVNDVLGNGMRCVSFAGMSHGRGGDSSVVRAPDS